MPSMRKPIIARETITYPKFHVTPENDPCQNTSLQCEHVLACGHLVSTARPNEPCAPNCHHIANRIYSKIDGKARTMSMVSFRCDACVEMDIEEKIPGHKWPHKAEMRAAMRAAEAKKSINFRKCYIGMKLVSVPCDEDGEIIGRYITDGAHHPFDTAIPRTGDNMFEDIDTTLPKMIGKKSKKQRANATQIQSFIALSDDSEAEPAYDSADDTSSVGEAVAENLEDTLAEGARWLQEQQELTRRRREEGTPSTRNRRAAARPIVDSSSPDTGLSSFVINNVSPLVAQTGQQDDAEPPQTSKKRKRATKDPNEGHD